MDGRELRLFSTVTTFDTPMDITIDDFAIESYCPADAESAAYFTEQRAVTSLLVRGLRPSSARDGAVAEES